MKRRPFLRVTGLVGGGLGIPAGRAFSQTDQSAALYAKFVPRDKKLDPEWVESLTTRGHPLDHGITHGASDVDPGVIGMTVGGIACGTVYLSGAGDLWVWDIFNQHHEGVVPNRKAQAPEGLGNIQGRSPRERDGANFLLPPNSREHRNGVVQHFTLHDGGADRRLSGLGTDWKEVSFTGRWPIGTVDFRDPSTPIRVRLEAFSPFIPLHLEDSSLPVTILDYTLTNDSATRREVTLTGLLENPLGQFSGLQALRTTTAFRGKGVAGIEHGLDSKAAPAGAREDRILFDFEEASLEGWEVTGSAFGDRPSTRATTPEYQGDLGAEGKGWINSHASAPGGDVGEKDHATGRLLSPEFTIDRRFLTFRIGGGRDAEKLAVRVLVDGKVVASATGHGSNRMRPEVFEVSGHEGRKARLEVVDRATGGWGNIGVDQVVLTDRHPQHAAAAEQLDAGTMCLAFLGGEDADLDGNRVAVRRPLDPGQSVTLRFAIGWFLPNVSPKLRIGKVRRHYAARFASAAEVVRHVAARQEELCGLTREWVRTWNDSSLPQWLLDRTVLPANTLQTENCVITEDGRFWAWEGIGCCPGTCGHVWQYAQGHARLFPEVERNLREVTDYGLAQNPDGSIRFRGTNAGRVAIDAQASYVLRTLRDHQLSDDPHYLQRVWEPARRALRYLVEFDRRDKRGGLDGLLDGAQHNTLDAEWYGKVHVLCTMYLAALRAGEELARAAGDDAFAKEARAVYEKGRANISTLFNGEYFIQDEDPAHLDAIGVATGCYIDQVMGQYWANQTGLGRLFDAAQQKSALRALWRHNFVPEYGSFREGFREGRHYATHGDSGLLMCTWPKGGMRPDFKKHWQYAYFNEFMTGFEYQAAAHMVAERDPDLVRNGLAVTRAIHDRYDARRGRNPYNEIECSDHYARAGAAYAVFLAVCGFHFDQAKGLLCFDPVIRRDAFRAPFTTSEAWGTYEQTAAGAAVTVTHGRLAVREVQLGAFEGRRLRARLNGGPCPDGEIVLKPSEKLEWKVEG